VSRDVVLATCAELPSGDPDDADLVPALAAHGVAARWQTWNDPAAAWGDAIVVLRSTWDYSARREDFLRWTATVPRLHNPADVLAWNTDKTYLAALGAAGLPIVPTRCFAPIEPVDLPDEGEVVIKPSVGAGSRGAGRFAAERRAEALAHAETLQAAGRTVVVQPYLAGVDTVGETALVYFDGSYSHAITKSAMIAPGETHALHSPHLFVDERIRATLASPDERAVGARVLDYLRTELGAAPLYARVDLLPSPDGPLIGELELSEPSLFLGYAGGAAERFAAAVAGRV
jgi:hypothetical protein